MSSIRLLASRTIAVAVLSTSTVCGRPPEEEVDESEVERPNPAADFCVEQDGEYLLESGECRLADGTIVDAWEHFRRHHQE